MGKEVFSPGISGRPLAFERSSLAALQQRDHWGSQYRALEGNLVLMGWAGTLNPVVPEATSSLSFLIL